MIPTVNSNIADDGSGTIIDMTCRNMFDGAGKFAYNLKGSGAIDPIAVGTFGSALTDTGSTFSLM